MITKFLCKIFNLIPYSELQYAKSHYEEIISSLKSENSSLLDKVSILESNIVRLKAVIIELNDKKSQQEATIRELNIICKEYEDKIKNIEKESATEYEKLNELNNELKRSIFNLQLQEKSLINQNNELHEKLTKSASDIEILTKEKDDIIANASSAANRIKDLEAIKDSQQLQISSLKNDNNVYKEKINEYSKRVESLSMEYATAEELLKNKHSQSINKLQAQIYKHQNEIEEKSAIISRYHRSIIEKDIITKEIEGEKETIKDQLERLKIQNSNLLKIIEEISNNSKDASADLQTLSVGRFLLICKSISQRTKIQNIMVIARKLLAEYFNYNMHQDFFAFYTNVIENNLNFQKENIAYYACFRGIFKGVKDKLSDVEIIRNAIIDIIKIDETNQSNGIKHDPAIIKHSYIDDNSKIMFDLNSADINQKDKEIIHIFKSVCYAISNMYTLNPQLKSVYKVALESISRYSSASVKNSFYTFVSCRTLDKNVSQYIKNCHVKILDLIIKENKGKDAIIAILQKDVHIFPQPNSHLFKEKFLTQEKSLEDSIEYILRFPPSLLTKREIILENLNKLLFYEDRLYLNTISRKTRIEKKYSSLKYTSNNIYITSYNSKKGLIYLNKDKVFQIRSPEFKVIVYKDDIKKFELYTVKNKMQTLTIDEILRTIYK